MKMIVLRHKAVTAALCLVAFVAIIAFVNHPVFVGASGNVRQLPIYCVEKDYKVCALSFDAAWADVRLRRESAGEKKLCAFGNNKI